MVTPEGVYEADVLIEDGVIKKIGKSLERGGAEEVIDASGMLVLPGAVDEHAHMREPGLTHKDDFASGTMAAAAGGVTTVLEMPNTLPPVDSAARLLEKASLLAPKAYVDFGLYGVIHDGSVDRIDEMVTAGAVGFKVFLGPTTGNIPPPSVKSIVKIMRKSQELGFTVAFHAEAHEVVELFTEEAKRLGDDPALHERARPPVAEVLAIRLVGTVQESAGGRSLIVHLSSKQAVEAVAEFKSRGIHMFAETCPHYIVLTAEDYKKYGALIKVNPPIRGPEHARALLEAINRGLIDTIGSDHAPHAEGEKRGAIWEAASGMPGVQTLLPLMVDLALRGAVDLTKIPLLLSRNPARLFGLWPTKGELRVGSHGDLVVVDPRSETVVEEGKLYYKHKGTSPFVGWRLRGAVKYTVLRGEVVARDGVVEGRPKGAWIKPARAPG